MRYKYVGFVTKCIIHVHYKCRKKIIDKVEVEKTPFEKTDNKCRNQVQIKSGIYKTYQTSLTKKFNDWFVGQNLIGGLTGLIIEPITGAMFSLSPCKIIAEMAKRNAFDYKKTKCT